MLKRSLVAAAMIAGALFSGPAQAACGKVTIADMNWPSATLMAHVDMIILKHGYGCDAELVPGDTIPTATSMIEKGEPDIAPELWSNAFAEALKKGVAEKRLRIAGRSLADGGEEGFWVPKYMVEKNPLLAPTSRTRRPSMRSGKPYSPRYPAMSNAPGVRIPSPRSRAWYQLVISVMRRSRSARCSGVRWVDTLCTVPFASSRVPLATRCAGLVRLPSPDFRPRAWRCGFCSSRGSSWLTCALRTSRDRPG